MRSHSSSGDLSRTEHLIYAEMSLILQLPNEVSEKIEALRRLRQKHNNKLLKLSMVCTTAIFTARVIIILLTVKYSEINNISYCHHFFL